jgi:hypothetical protein
MKKMTSTETYSFYTPVLDMGETPIVITKTREEILDEHWDFWHEKMVQEHGEHSDLITGENCIQDWCTMNQAWKNKKLSLLDALQEVGKLQEESRNEYDEDAEKFWDSLSHDGQLKAFYSVCKRIYEGDVVKKGSYRYVLYDVFQFDMSSYGVGMECRYMELHNLIGEGLEKKSDKA